MQQVTNNEMDYSEAKTLWLAVIAQAIKDTQLEGQGKEERLARKQAEEWLSMNNESFLTVCIFVGVSPERVIERVKSNKRISTKRIVKGGRRHLVA